MKYLVTIISQMNNSDYVIGTGFFVSKFGHVVTCAHNISMKRKTYVYYDTKIYKARIINTDKRADICVLKIKEDTVDYLLFSTTCRIGDRCHLYNSMEEYGTFSKQCGTIQNNGVVSRDVFDSVITNMNVSKGNSGSPILNENGKVIALTSWFIPNQISGGCGTMLKTIVQKLLNEKMYTRGYIGFSTIPLFPKDILGYNITFTHDKVFGVIVTRTYISEICENDIITHVNNVELNMNTQSLESLVYLKKIGTNMHVTFHKYNGGQWNEIPQTINVIVQEYPEVEDIPIINGKKELLR